MSSKIITALSVLGVLGVSTGAMAVNTDIVDSFNDNGPLSASAIDEATQSVLPQPGQALLPVQQTPKTSETPSLVETTPPAVKGNATTATPKIVAGSPSNVTAPVVQPAPVAPAPPAEPVVQPAPVDGVTGGSGSRPRDIEDEEREYEEEHEGEERDD